MLLPVAVVVPKANASADSSQPINPLLPVDPRSMIKPRSLALLPAPEFSSIRGSLISVFVASFVMVVPFTVKLPVTTMLPATEMSAVV